MKELEDTKCEVRRTIDLQFSIWDRLNASLEEEGAIPLGTPGYNGGANPLGNFFDDATYAWLSCGSTLVVVNVKTGTGVSSWTFGERVTCVSQFPAQPGQIPLLLVGLDNGASKARDSSGLVCILDCTTSQVLRAIRMPAGVEQACVVNGGADWEVFGDTRNDILLGECSGIACVALRNLDHLMIDLRRTSWDGPGANPLADEASPAELIFTESNETNSSRHRSSREKHAAYNLMNSRLEQYIGFNREEFETSSIYQESLTSSLICSRKIGCIVSGCLGRIIIWQTDGDVRWISAPLDESMSITHLALLEPTDDPRPFCYLWSAYQEETCRSPPILRMYSMLFERKYNDKGANTYLNLEADPSVKFELELDDNEIITSLCPIVRDSNSEQTDISYKRGEESILLISMEKRAIIFDLNQWYKEQMPQTIGDSNNPNAIVANYPTRRDINITRDDIIVNCAYIPATLKEFPCNGTTPSEELFFPNSLSLEWIDLSTTRLIFWSTRGIQAELLREISITGPVIMIEPTETFHRCVSVGLVTTNGDFSINTDKDLQRDIILSLCLEQRWSQFLLRCANEWSDGSATYLFHAFLRWGMQRASSIKLSADRLSIPLYDQSGTGIGQAEVKQLRFYCQQLECISNVVTNLRIDNVDLTKERRTLRRVSTYLQVLLWFHDVGLLPETQENDDDDSTLPMSLSLKIPYPYERLATIYRDKRLEFLKKSTKKLDDKEEDMFIDELLTRECTALKSQWEREGGENSKGGYYPPSSLQSLLRSYMTDCHETSDFNEMENKHRITIYLLMDLEMLLQNSYPCVDQLIEYPSAFKLSPSMIKLTQALRFLDHENYHGFLDIMTGQLVSDNDVKDWHHRHVMRTLIRKNQNKLALIYLRVRKPPLSSLDDQSIVISLSVEHGLVQSAFHRRPPSHYSQLLLSFYRACKKYGKLNDILHLSLNHEEEEVFVKFLENEKTEDTRLLFYLQRCRYAEASKVYPHGSTASSSRVTRNNDKSASLAIFNAYNATLPDITRKFSANFGSRSQTNTIPESRYPRPMSHCKSRAKIRDIHEFVMKKARETFLHYDRSRIPFVSAPCFTMKSTSSNIDGNTVQFVERLKKLRGKRSLDEMRDDDFGIIENEDDRKRRKIMNSSKDNGESKKNREIDTSMVFDTPLVKRKKQLFGGRETAMETPHSILKIRQLIRDSTSPHNDEDRSRKIGEKNIHERERKRRQIRFSLGQQQINNDEDDDDDENDDDEQSITSDARLTDNNVEIVKKLDENEIAEEGEFNENKNLIEDDEISEEEVFEEAYYSPNVSQKSYYEPTLLNDATNVSMNISGPRPRPSLRRSNESTGCDIEKKSLKSSNISTESTRLTSELSFTINDDNENNATSSFITEEPNFLSETAYTASILSSDTSFELTLPTKLPRNEKTPSRRSIRQSTFSFIEKSIDKHRDSTSLSLDDNERSENLRKFDETTARRSSIKRRSTVFEDFINDHDEDKNSEILMEVDGFGLDRESSNQSLTKNHWDVDNNLDRRENMGATALSNITEISVKLDEDKLVRERESPNVDNNENEEMEQNDSDSTIEASPGFVVPETNEIEDKIVNDEKFIVKDRENVANEDYTRESENNENEIEEIVDELTKREISLPKYHENPEIEINTTEIAKSTDDYDDELLALRYEEDDEETEENDDDFQSLSNSLEIRHSRSKSSLEKSITPCDLDNETMKKSTNSSINNGFYEIPIAITSQDTNITDDESSRSVDGSILNVDSRITRNEHEKTLPIDIVQPDVINEASNMTNDDSTSSFDSSIFSVKKPTQDLTKVTNTLIDEEKIINEHDTSQDSSLFTSKKSRNILRIEENIVDTGKKNKEKRQNVSSSLSTSSIVETAMSNKTDNDVSSISSDSTKERENDESSTTNRAKSEKLTIEKIDETKRSESPIAEMEVTTPLRMTRARRASSVAREQSPMLESPIAGKSTIGRLRRTSSLAKDFFPLANLSSPVKQDRVSSRLRRSVSLVKEATPVKSRANVEATRQDEKEEEEKDEEEKKKNEEDTPIGRRTRRATSVQKEIIVPTRTKMTRSSSKISLSEDTNLEESSTSRKKPTTRAKKVSVTSKDTEDIVAPKRLTRASSLVKDTPEKKDDEETTVTRRVTRKRGNSVPKETIMETNTRSAVQRKRRGSSVATDVIPEETSESIDDNNRSRTIKSLREVNVAKVEKIKPLSPSTRTRSRLSSISSINEDNVDKEKEDNEETDSDEIFTWRGSTTEIKKNTRTRRAASADLPQVTVKRRTRAASAKSAIIDEPIEEETSDIDEIADRKTKLSKRAPVRRKRTVSATTSRDVGDEIVFDKLPTRRARKFSEKSNENETFSFSPPGKAQDRPDNEDEKGTTEVPNYVFSPPHTRSKHINPQPRSKVNRDFIPLTEEERAAGKRAMEGLLSRPLPKLFSETRDPFDLYGPRKIFSFSKRSKSVTEDSTGSSQRDRKG